MKRRGFIRTVIAGGAGMAITGLPYERVYAQAPGKGSMIRTNRRHIVREPAHMIRDGHQFHLPPPTEFKDVVIVGAGANSLVAAYSLPDAEVVCLEKEPRCGGNAQRSQWRGIHFTEGAAYTRSNTELGDFLFSEFGIKPIPTHGDVGYTVGKQIIRGFYGDGFDQLPYDESIRAQFHRFARTTDETAARLSGELGELYQGKPTSSPALRAELLQLERVSLEQWLEDNGYPQEVIDWCDVFCPTDANAYPKDMSAIAGLVYMSNMENNYTGLATYPGGLATMAEALEAGVREQGANRIRTGAFVVSVVNTEDGKHVDVTYLQATNLHTIRCKTCIWGGQKHIGAYVIKGMPEEQKAAIGRMKYNDLSVMNLCYDRRIYDRGMITWLDKAPVNNFLSADWVLNAGEADPGSPQVLTCDWSNRPEHRALLLDDAWVVEQCQATAHRMEEIFPGSINHLVEIRLPLRAHSWVTMTPGYLSDLKPVISRDIGRVIVSPTDHNSFDGAYAAGLENATKAREWIN